MLLSLDGLFNAPQRTPEPLYEVNSYTEWSARQVEKNTNYKQNYPKKWQKHNYIKDPEWAQRETKYDSRLFLVWTHSPDLKTENIRVKS